MRTCRKYYQKLTLLASNDLNPEEERGIRAHLQACPRCQAAYRQVERFIERAQEQAPFPPPQGLLDECRAELRERLRLQRMLGGPHPSFLPRRPLVLAAATATFALALGVVVGRYLLPSRASAPQSIASMGAEDLGVRALDREWERVEVQLGEVLLRGPVTDPRMRPFLVQALAQAENPGQRLRVVKVLAAQPLLDEDVEAALISAMEQDPNSGVRLQAIRALRAFPLTKPVKEALIRVLLTERNPSLRKEAIDALTVRPFDPETASALRGLARADTSAYVRRKAGIALERRDNVAQE
ncbi:MAG: HEAT repeat domain-containing protein [candidate division KSB1 bacterium]|nr:HEAT repeat domain-containing protein [candidate division KSB1 bacterium]